MNQEIEMYGCFEKLYWISNSEEEWVLPNPQTLHKSEKWEIPELMAVKKHLNNVKGRLNNFPLQKWRKHTRSRNPSLLVVKKLRRELELDFVTQAWCKFYEAVCTFELIPQSAIEAGELKTVHLCEAPGAFIAALNHYLASNVPNMKWDWLATSLNPHHEGNGIDYSIFDDRLILETLEKWSYGADHTGDLTKLDNMRHFEQEVERRGFKENNKLLLVTADGGFDCQDNPAQQEKTVMNLLLCEAVTAMNLLDKGGNLVLKAFTIFEAETVCFVYLLSCSFESLATWKPATSKEGNSEIYIVGLGYRGRETLQPWLDALSEYYGVEKDVPMFSRDDLPKEFVDHVIQLSKKFMDFQASAIEDNINTFQTGENPRAFKRMRYLYQKNTYKLQHSIANHYMERYRLKSIPKNAQLYPSEEGYQPFAYTQLNDLYDVEGDLTFRTMMQGTNFLERRKSLAVALEKSDIIKNHYYQCDPSSFFDTVDIAVCKIHSIDFKLDVKDLIIGPPVKEIKSSKFCHVWFLKLHKKIMELWEDLNDTAQIENALVVSKSYCSNTEIPSTTRACTSSTNSCYEKTSFAMEHNSSIKGEMPLAEVADVEACERNSLFCRIKILFDNVAEEKCKTYFWEENISSKTLEELINLIKKLENGGSLLVKHLYPLLKKFDAGLLNLLGSLFSQVLFLWPSKGKKDTTEFYVLLHKLCDSSDNQMKIIGFLSQVYKIIQEEENKDFSLTILDLISIKHLCKGSFYNCVLYTNHLYLEYSAKEILKKCSEKLGLDENPGMMSKKP